METFGPSLTDCSFLIALRIQSTNQRAIGYVYTGFWDNITFLIIKSFQFVTRLHKLIFFVYYILSKYNFLLHWYTKSTLPPLRACTISYTQTLVFFTLWLRKKPKEILQFLKLKQFVSTRDIFFSFYQRKIKVFAVYIRQTFVWFALNS